MSLASTLSTLAHAALHPLQTTRAAYDVLISPVQSASIKQCIDLLSCVSVNGLQLLAICPTLLSLLGTPQVEEAVAQSMALLQQTHHMLQSNKLRDITDQVLALLASPACATLIQQLSDALIATLRICQTEQFLLANKQFTHALEAVLQQLQPVHTTASAVAVATPTPADRDELRDATEWSEWLDMLLCCHRLHCSGRISAMQWATVRGMVEARDERAMQLWRQWKSQVSLWNERTVRDESAQYQLAGEVDKSNVIDAKAQETGPDIVLFVAKLHSLIE